MSDDQPSIKAGTLRRPLVVYALAVLLTIDCVLYLVILSGTPDSCTPQNIECDGFGQLEDLMQAVSVVTAIALILAVWLIWTGRLWAWVVTIFLMSWIFLYTILALFGGFTNEGYSGASWHSASVKVLNLIVFALLVLPPVFRWVRPGKRDNDLIPPKPKPANRVAKID